MTKHEFIEAHPNLVIKGEFEFKGKEWLVYNIHRIDPVPYVTSEALGWKWGLRYSRKIRQVVKEFLVEEDIKDLIESRLCGF